MPFSFRTDESAKEKLKGLNLGYLEFSNVKNEKSNDVVDSIINAACASVEKKFPDKNAIYDDPIINGLKTLFSNAGLDSTKTKPSGEALTIRVVTGKGIYRINSVVDVNNSISLLTGFPCGVYNIKKLEGNEISVLIGNAENSYIGLDGNPHSCEKKIMTADAQGVFGGPAADSKRTSITPESTEVLMIIYCPPIASLNLLKNTMEKAAAFMEKATGGKKTTSGIYTI